MTSIEQQPETRDIVLVVHHETDGTLYSDLAPHLNMLSHRLPQIAWKYHTLPLPVMEHQKDKRQAFFDDLARTSVFVPCLSAKFLDTFWQTCQRDPRILAGLYHASIVPIALRLVADAESLIQTPLAASRPGHERDQACIWIVNEVKEQLRMLMGENGQELRLSNILEETACMRLLKGQA